jgi:hypothetical protein
MMETMYEFLPDAGAGTVGSSPVDYPGAVKIGSAAFLGWRG